jgi:hypothetical protein
MLAELTDGQTDGTEHVETPSSSAAGPSIGQTSLEAFGIARRMPAQRGEGSFVEGGQRRAPRPVFAGTVGTGRGHHVLDMFGEFVDRGARQHHTSRGGATQDLESWVERRGFTSHGPIRPA